MSAQTLFLNSRNYQLSAARATACLLLLVFLNSTARADKKKQEQESLPQSAALTEFLQRFDPISRQGYVRTQRSGATGIGYTLETLLGIRENNSPRGDLMGMEIKAYRDGEWQFDDHGKMNLFLKEPEWAVPLSSAERIRTYGYTDEQGRPAWYQSVTVKPNSKGLELVVDARSRRLQMKHKGQLIGWWTSDILKKRLEEKLTEVVFVSAASRNAGKDEEFHFRAVTYCTKPSVARLLKLVQSGDVIVELRMHVQPSGQARNHGTAFRLKKHRLADLFEHQVLVRPVVQPQTPPQQRIRAAPGKPIKKQPTR